MKKVRGWVEDGKAVLPQGPYGVYLYDTSSGYQTKNKIMTYDQVMRRFNVKGNVGWN